MAAVIFKLGLVELVDRDKGDFALVVLDRSYGGREIDDGNL